MPLELGISEEVFSLKFVDFHLTYSLFTVSPDVEDIRINKQILIHCTFV